MELETHRNVQEVSERPAVTENRRDYKYVRKLSLSKCSQKVSQVGMHWVLYYVLIMHRLSWSIWTWCRWLCQFFERFLSQGSRLWRWWNRGRWIRRLHRECGCRFWFQGLGWHPASFRVFLSLPERRPPITLQCLQNNTWQIVGYLDLLFVRTLYFFPVLQVRELHQQTIAVDLFQRSAKVRNK